MTMEREPKTLDTLLEEVAVTCHCPLCGRDWPSMQPQAVVAMLTKPDGKVHAWCATCSERPRETKPVPAPARPDPWDDICPAEFRLASEGGQTDRDRLKKAWGTTTDGVRMSCGQIAELVTHPGPVILAGVPGTLKTRLAWRMVRLVWDRPAAVRCFTSWQFQSELQDASGAYRSGPWMRDLSEAALVFIDDLGKAEWTANTHGAFFELTDSRIRQRRPLLITTNDTLAGVQGSRAGHKSAVAQSTAEALVRRFRDFAARVVMQKPTP